MYIYQIERELLTKQVTACAKFVRGEVLDVGGGSMSRYRHLFSGRTSYVALDIRPGPEIDIVASADDIPLPDASKDSVVSTQVLEHVKYPEKCVQEMARVLRKGGHALVTAPQWNELHDEPYDYWRYTKYGLIELFERNGFRVVEELQRGGLFSTAGQMTIRYLIDRFHLYEHPLAGRVMSRLFRVVGAFCQFLDRMDTSAANRKHAIGWCFVFARI